MGFVVMETIGQGGMGTIYRAVDPTIESAVAIKVLRARAQDGRAAERFRHEAAILARLKHPHIVDVYSFGRLPDGRFYYVMEYLRGTDLRRYLRREERLSWELALSLITQAASAVDAAHRLGVIHRDVSCGNIFLLQNEVGFTTTPQLKLLDFGIAKTLRVDAVDTTVTSGVGTPAYMAPEQLLGARIDHRVDLYALATVLFHLLSGHPPPRGFTDTPVQTELLQGLALPEHVPAVLQRALSFRREQRHSSAAELVAALRGERTIPELGPAQPAVTRASAALKRRWIALGLAVAATGAGIATWRFAAQDTSPVARAISAPSRDASQARALKQKALEGSFAGTALVFPAPAQQREEDRQRRHDDARNGAQSSRQETPARRRRRPSQRQRQRHDGGAVPQHNRPGQPAPAHLRDEVIDF